MESVDGKMRSWVAGWPVNAARSHQTATQPVLRCKPWMNVLRSSDDIRSQIPDMPNRTGAIGLSKVIALIKSSLDHSHRRAFQGPESLKNAWFAT